MIYISIKELKNNLDFYLDKSQEEDVFVVQNNQIITVLTNPQLYALYKAECQIQELNIKDDLADKNYKDLIGECILEKNKLN